MCYNKKVARFGEYIVQEFFIHMKWVLTGNADKLSEAT
jgi:hypothetical protein